MNLKQMYAISKKEVKLNLRFKYDFFFRAVSNPIRMFISFSIIYNGFFLAGAQGIGGVEKANYILFLLIGAMAHTLFVSAFYIFNRTFIREKYWRTIQAILIAPVSRMSLVFGFGFSELFRQLLILPIFIVVCLIISPIAFTDLVVVLATLLALFFGVLGFSFVQGGFALSNENYLFVFQYLFWIWSFFSCFFYPIEAIPDILQPIVEVNPVYHGLTIIRGLWMQGHVPDLPLHAAYVILFAVASPLVSIRIFSGTIKRYGITGY